jgi:hypothetical protein
MTDSQQNYTAFMLQQLKVTASETRDQRFYRQVAPTNAVKFPSRLG